MESYILTDSSTTSVEALDSKPQSTGDGAVQVAVVSISKSDSVKSVVQTVLKKLTSTTTTTSTSVSSPPTSKLILRGIGSNINKAVSAAEIIKRKHSSKLTILAQETRIFSTTTDTWDPIPSAASAASAAAAISSSASADQLEVVDCTGLSRIIVSRHLPCIEISISPVV